KNPAPFSGYADFGRTQVISCSPERFVRVLDREVETRPIKGTRPRLSDPIADAGIAQLLLQSTKDRSENVMIVDLLRNDLSRVAEPASLKVTQLCGLEQYRFVWHLVSVVTARLGTGKTPAELLTAMFPGGSITGAPKIRAMEIIAELEPTARGPYCGSLGYWSFAGDMDTSILIRTVTACDGWWQVPVGGGIVAASDPHLEEQETWHKAEGILRAIDSLGNVSCDTMVSVLPH
ncbi:MAG: anthranilate synthase component I family protein, partial [Planctomycetales bacterium]|nr:anthranilate synthase component I family protein [Planctomycetales bacterium]